MAWPGTGSPGQGHPAVLARDAVDQTQHTDHREEEEDGGKERGQRWLGRQIAPLGGSMGVLACSGAREAPEKRWQQGLQPHSEEESILQAGRAGLGACVSLRARGRDQDEGRGEPRELQPLARI